MKTLIAEDDLVNSAILQKIVEPYGKYDIAKNGEETIIKFLLASSYHLYDPYDLILLDINMPKKDGHTVLSEIRKYESMMGIKGLDGVKIIMATASDDKKDIFKAFKNQCEDYIVKPYNKQTIFPILKKLNLV